jgi:hypothetical protein
MALTKIKSTGIADDAVTAGKIAAGAVVADITTGSVTATHLAGSIPLSKTNLTAGNGISIATDTVAVSSSLGHVTSVGTIGTGVWQGTPITSAYLNASQTAITSVGTLTALTVGANAPTSLGTACNIGHNSGSGHVASIYNGTDSSSASGLQVQGGYNASTFALRVKNAYNTDLLWVGGLGKVGIGTSSPAHLLEIYKDGGVADLMVKGANGGASASIIIAGYTSSTLSLYRNVSDPTWELERISGSNDLKLEAVGSHDSETGAGNVMYWDYNTGRVGIGTTSPDRQVEIYGTNDGYLKLDGGRSGNHGYTLGSDSSGFVIYDDTLNAYRIVIDQDSGKVGIGTESPQYQLDITSDSGGYANMIVHDSRAYNTGSGGLGGGTGGGIAFGGKYHSNGAVTDWAMIRGVKDDNVSGNYAGYLQFATRSQSAWTQRMKIASDGTSSFYGTVSIQANPSGDGSLTIDSTLTNDTAITFYNENVMTWRLRSKGNVSDRFEFRDAGGDDGVLLSQGGTSWSSGSDERLKCNWTSFDDALSDINSLTKVGTFQYKNFGEDEPRNDKIHAGLSAQEVMKFLPSAVDAEEGEDSSEGFLSMRYQELIPVLVKAIQELSAKVETLENA